MYLKDGVHQEGVRGRARGGSGGPLGSQDLQQLHGSCSQQVQRPPALHAARHGQQGKLSGVDGWGTAAGGLAYQEKSQGCEILPGICRKTPMSPPPP